MNMEKMTVETGISEDEITAKRLEDELETAENKEEVIEKIATELPYDGRIAPQYKELTEQIKSYGYDYDLTTAEGRAAFKAATQHILDKAA